MPTSLPSSRSWLALFCIATLAASVPAQQARYRDLVFSAVERTNGIAYGSAVNRFTNLPETLLLDRYAPQNDTASARAAVVIVHGGGFVGGSRSTAQMVQLGNDFARRGYVAVSIDYRLKPTGTPITAQVIEDAGHDFKAAVRWLRANAATLRLDGRIAAIGSSAGSITILDATYADHGEGGSGNPGFPSTIHACADLWGSMADPSAMTGNEAPLIVVHGTNDTTVPYAGALALVAQAQAVGLPYELWPIVGAGHAPWSAYFQDHHDDVVAFYWQHLRLGELAGLGIRPGFGSPGTVATDVFGLPGELAFIALADQTVAQPLPPLGTLWLTGTVIILPMAVLPTTPRLPSISVVAPVPPGLGGLTLHWQALTTGGVAGVLTNRTTIML